MTYAEWMSKATPEQRQEVADRVRKIIGTREQAVANVKDLTERIKRSNSYQKEFELLSKVFFEHGEKALAMNYMQYGRNFEGVTASGKKWILERNHGWAERSRNCGSLWIQGEGTVFTSGRIDKVFDYILNA